MPAVACIGDSISHGGNIITGSSDVFCNGIGVARRYDSVLCAQHGLQTIIGGSETVFADGRNLARIGDAISCGAVITTGSPNVYAG